MPWTNNEQVMRGHYFESWTGTKSSIILVIICAVKNRRAAKRLNKQQSVSSATVEETKDEDEVDPNDPLGTNWLKIKMLEKQIGGLSRHKETRLHFGASICLTSAHFDQMYMAVRAGKTDGRVVCVNPGQFKPEDVISFRIVDLEKLGSYRPVHFDDFVYFQVHESNQKDFDSAHMSWLQGSVIGARPKGANQLPTRFLNKGPSDAEPEDAQSGRVSPDLMKKSLGSPKAVCAYLPGFVKGGRQDDLMKAFADAETFNEKHSGATHLGRWRIRPATEKLREEARLRNKIFGIDAKEGVVLNLDDVYFEQDFVHIALPKPEKTKKGGHEEDRLHNEEAVIFQPIKEYVRADPRRKNDETMVDIRGVWRLHVANSSVVQGMSESEKHQEEAMDKARKCVEWSEQLRTGHKNYVRLKDRSTLPANWIETERLPLGWEELHLPKTKVDREIRELPERYPEAHFSHWHPADRKVLEKGDPNPQTYYYNNLEPDPQKRETTVRPTGGQRYYINTRTKEHSFKRPKETFNLKTDISLNFEKYFKTPQEDSPTKIKKKTQIAEMKREEEKKLEAESLSAGTGFSGKLRRSTIAKRVEADFKRLRRHRLKESDSHAYFEPKFNDVGPSAESMEDYQIVADSVDAESTPLNFTASGSPRPSSPGDRTTMSEATRGTDADRSFGGSTQLGSVGSVSSHTSFWSYGPKPGKSQLRVQHKTATRHMTMGGREANKQEVRPSGLMLAVLLLSDMTLSLLNAGHVNHVRVE